MINIYIIIFICLAAINNSPGSDITLHELYDPQKIDSLAEDKDICFYRKTAIPVYASAYDFFEAEGLKLKVERGNRVFPMSDRSADVLDTLRRAMRSAGVQVHLNTEVKSVRKQEDGFTLQLADKTLEQTDKVIVATGGISYESTGSTGDGYRFAESFGLKVTDCVPSLVPFNVKEDWVKELQGLSLKNVSIKILDGKKRLYEDFGEMMFTHFGVTGPLILTASSVCARKIREKQVKLILEQCYHDAVELLKENMDDMHKVVAYLLEKETITGAEMVAIIEGRDPSTVEDAYASTLAHENGFRPSQPEVIEPAAKKVHMISEKIEAPEASPGPEKKANSADNATQPEAEGDKPAEPKPDTDSEASE